MIGDEAELPRRGIFQCARDLAAAAGQWILSLRRSGGDKTAELNDLLSVLERKLSQKFDDNILGRNKHLAELWTFQKGGDPKYIHADLARIKALCLSTYQPNKWDEVVENVGRFFRSFKQAPGERLESLAHRALDRLRPLDKRFEFDEVYSKDAYERDKARALFEAAPKPAPETSLPAKIAATAEDSPQNIELNKRLGHWDAELKDISDYTTISNSHPNENDNWLHYFRELAGITAQRTLLGHDLNSNLARIKNLCRETDRMQDWERIVNFILEKARRMKGLVIEGTNYEKEMRMVLRALKSIDQRFSGTALYGRQKPEEEKSPAPIPRGQLFDSPPASRIHYDSKTAPQLKNDILNYLLLENFNGPPIKNGEMRKARFHQALADPYLVDQLKQLRAANQKLYDETVVWILKHREKNLPGISSSWIFENLAEELDEPRFRKTSIWPGVYRPPR